MGSWISSLGVQLPSPLHRLQGEQGEVRVKFRQGDLLPDGVLDGRGLSGGPGREHGGDLLVPVRQVQGSRVLQEQHPALRLGQHLPVLPLAADQKFLRAGDRLGLEGESSGSSEVRRSSGSCWA